MFSNSKLGHLCSSCSKEKESEKESDTDAGKVSCHTETPRELVSHWCQRTLPVCHYSKETVVFAFCLVASSTLDCPPHSFPDTSHCVTLSSELRSGEPDTTHCMTLSFSKRSGEPDTTHCVTLSSVLRSIEPDTTHCVTLCSELRSAEPDTIYTRCVGRPARTTIDLALSRHWKVSKWKRVIQF